LLIFKCPFNWFSGSKTYGSQKYQLQNTFLKNALVNTLLKIALKSTFLPVLNYPTSWTDLGVTSIGHGPL
jgi:hypothetical protein